MSVDKIPSSIDQCQETKLCERCGKEFFRNKKYSNQQWVKAKTCSRRCGAIKRDVANDIEICRMYNDGRSCAEIAKVYGMSSVQIQRILKENGVKVDMYRMKKGGLHISKGGYIRFDYSKGNGFHAGRKVHTLIAEMVLGRMLCKDEVVHHIDGDKLNNHPNNLAVISKGEHTILHLEKDNRKKLSESEVNSIRSEHEKGTFKQAEAARRYGVSRSLINNILAGRARVRKNV